MDFLLLIVGLAGLWYGTELTIRGAVSVARNLHLSEFIVGIAVLSIGSDLPELTIAVDAGIRKLEGGDTSDLVIGSAIGSCLGQIGLVLGVAGLLGHLTLPRRMVFLHGGVMLGALVVLALIGMDFVITRTEGFLLLIFYAVYFAMLLADQNSYEKPNGDEPTLPMLRAWLLVAVGLAIVIGGAELTVRSAIEVALDLDIDQAIVAIVIVGVGTSLPELSISVGAIMRKRASMSVGNLIGSNIFDTLIPIGAAAAIAGLDFNSDLLQFDLTFLFVLSTVVLLFFLHRRGLKHFEALIILSLYILYVLIRLGRA